MFKVENHNKVKSQGNSRLSSLLFLTDLVTTKTLVEPLQYTILITLFTILLTSTITEVTKKDLLNESQINLRKWKRSKTNFSLKINGGVTRKEPR